MAVKSKFDDLCPLFKFALDLKFRKSRNVDLIWKGGLKLMIMDIS